jgi:hypothetical protein
MTESRLRQVHRNNEFEDLSDKSAGARITAELDRIYNAINEDRKVENLPSPTGFTASSKPAAILLEWDNIAAAYRGSVLGMRIWRSTYTATSKMGFNENTDKRIIVDSIRSTSYLDQLSFAAEYYIYWIQWVNLDGVASSPSKPLKVKTGANVTTNSTYGTVVIDEVGIRCYDPLGNILFYVPPSSSSAPIYVAAGIARYTNTFTSVFTIDGIGTPIFITGDNSYGSGLVGIYIDPSTQEIGFTKNGIAWGYWNQYGLNLAEYKVVKVNGKQVITARQTGWTACSGSALRSGYAAHPGQTISTTFDSTQLQTVDDNLKAVSQTLKALIDDLMTHGLIHTT